MNYSFFHRFVLIFGNAYLSSLECLVLFVFPIYSFKIFWNIVRQVLIVFYVMHDFSDFQFENII